MANNIIELDLLQYRGIKSSVFTGRPQGEQARQNLNLDNLDNSNNAIHFVVPSGTTTITPSFFLGMLFDSIKKLGFEVYKQKYFFNFKETSAEIVEILKSNIAEGERNAINTVRDKRGYTKFLKANG